METRKDFLEKARLSFKEYLGFWAHQRRFKVDWKPKGVVVARANHGRWLAHCPFCTGAELVDPDEPTFFCFSCNMEGNGHAVITVKFPKSRGKIEELLATRPKAQTRNWEPGETLKMLRAENKSHGLGV